MKIILSRREFDSSSGSCASPILPDGQMISFPIPAAREQRSLAEMNRHGVNLGNQTFAYVAMAPRVNGAAKTLADCFRYRNTLGLNTMPKAVADLRVKGPASASNLMRHASLVCVTDMPRRSTEAAA